jgi:phage tail sheath protein FI
VLNAAQVTALIRSDSGFRFWGNRTCADDPLFVFESTVRVAQLLADTVARGMVWAMDKDLTPSLARDIVETVNGFFLDLKTAGVILGAKAWFDETDNPVDSLKAGKLRIDYDYGAPAARRPRLQPAHHRQLLRRFCQPARRRAEACRVFFLPIA